MADGSHKTKKDTVLQAAKMNSGKFHHAKKVACHFEKLLLLFSRKVKHALGLYFWYDLLKVTILDLSIVIRIN